MKVKRIIAYTLSVLVLLFSIVAILGIWEVVDIEDLIARMFKSLDGHSCSCSSGCSDFLHPGPTRTRHE